MEGMDANIHASRVRIHKMKEQQIGQPQSLDQWTRMWRSLGGRSFRLALEFFL